MTDAPGMSPRSLSTAASYLSRWDFRVRPWVPEPRSKGMQNVSLRSAGRSLVTVDTDFVMPLTRVSMSQVYFACQPH